MDPSQIALPILGIVAAAAATFYVVSFGELREKSLRDIEDSEPDSSGGYRPIVSSRERRARRKAEKEAKKN
ncbi:hypothetical protein QJS04_geneDACA017783 [Acorus gramineus]|uniref:Transmembrane protein n=1 Tax=Acorus gramineus TaxID=55184 RepID=A0AAV8ZY86_ACOGR|nr:hypothetical protein QJS04_geneDACA019787 [Acorus gramineus]KAK1280961.1 hypothetical protein QJS04_geneDACA017783 [Acorus gramineus]